jgi:uracil-DNA glycosylase family 4
MAARKRARAGRDVNVDQRKPSKYLDFSVAEAVATLRWWSGAGVESAVDEVPRNHFIDEAQPPFTPEHALPRRTPVDTPVFASAGRGGAEAQRPPPDVAARDLAASAPDLATLKAIWESFEGCGLKRTATQLVFADGAPGSRVMFVGEAPGGDEDRIGRPFVGRAGQLLDRMLKSIGLDRGQVYIANVVPWRPPGNRTPTLQETLACLPFIKRQIEFAQPEILVCLGASAAQTLLGLRQGITRARGTWSEYHCENGRTLRSLAMLHPAYLLRQPGQKRQAWTDMRALAKELAI